MQVLTARRVQILAARTPAHVRAFRLAEKLGVFRFRVSRTLHGGQHTELAPLLAFVQALGADRPQARQAAREEAVDDRLR